MIWLVDDNDDHNTSVVFCVRPAAQPEKKKKSFFVDERELWFNGSKFRYGAVHHIFGKNHSGKEFKLVLGSL